MGLKLRKQTKRKKYQLIDTVNFVMEGAAFISENVLNKIRMMELQSIDAFVKGHGTKTDWLNLTDMLNISELMAKAGIGPEALDTVMKAQNELLKSAERYKMIGKFGLTGVGIQLIRDSYEYHDLQRQSISRGEYERFITKARNKIQSRSRDVVYVESVK